MLNDDGAVHTVGERIHSSFTIHHSSFVKDDPT